ALNLRRLADEQRAAADAERPHQRRRQRLVAPAEDADQHRDEEGGDQVEPEGREVLAGADRERKRERGNENDRRDDPARTLAQLAAAVEVVAPEDEDEQEDEEREPVGLV